MWLLFACAPTPDAEVAPLTIPTFTVPGVAAIWTAEEAVLAIENALVAPFPSPFVVRESLSDWFEHGDEGCPGPGTWMSGPSFEGCTSAEGWYFLGVGGFTELPFEDEHGEGFELTMMGDLAILAPDGASIDIGGHWLTTAHEGPAWHGIVNGTWREPLHPVDWLATGISAWLNFAGGIEATGPAAWLDGGLTLRGTSLLFRDFHVGLAECGGLPAGSVEVLDPGGGWWAFDFGELCEPCDVRFDGVDVATDACPTLPDLAGDISVAFPS